jgi:hypothetical protein
MAIKKGCFIRSLKIIGILLVVLAVLSVSLFFLATGAPVSYPAPGFDGGDKSVVANIITRLARSLVDKEGRVVETAVLQLSRNEVQTLLDAAVAKSDNFKHETLPYAAVWDEGKLLVRYSMPLTASRAANLSVEVSPVVDRGQLTLIPGGGSMGHFPLPPKALDLAAKKLTQMAMENDSTRTMLSAFTRIEPGEDGTLLLMFDPRNVNTVVRVLRSAGSPDSMEDPDEEDDEDPDEEDDEDPDEEDDEEDEEETEE